MTARGFCTCRRDFPGIKRFHPPAGATWHYLCDKPVAPWPVAPCTDHNMTGPDHDSCARSEGWWSGMASPAQVGQASPSHRPTGTGWPS